MRNLSELNINVRGQTPERRSPTDEMIRAFEAHYALSLPDDYVKLLRHSNGGHPELDSIQPVGRPNASIWTVNWFYHLADDRNSTNNLWRVMEEWRPTLGQQVVPFAADGGGNQFVLDLRTTPHTVCVCIHDEQFKIVEIAPSFETFIDLLSFDPDMI